jgi:hypothetical protein
LSKECLDQLVIPLDARLKQQLLLDGKMLWAWEILLKIALLLMVLSIVSDWTKLDQFQHVPHLDAIKNQLPKHLPILFLYQNQLMEIGARWTLTGELTMLLITVTWFKDIQSQLVLQSNAKKNRWHILQTMPQLFLTGVRAMSIGNLITLLLLERKTCFKLNQFQLALLLSA